MGLIDIKGMRSVSYGALTSSEFFQGPRILHRSVNAADEYRHVVKPVSGISAALRSRFIGSMSLAPRLRSLPVYRETPIADLALAREREGRTYEADLLYRFSNARLESSRRIDSAIERMTERLLGKGLAVIVRRAAENDDTFTHIVLKTPTEVRDFLRRELHSRLTLMDLVELVNIGGPLVPLGGIAISHRALSEFRHEIEVEGLYARQDIRGRELSYDVGLAVAMGMPGITSRNIYVGNKLRRMGIGAASLCAALEFAVMHKIPEWTGLMQEEGLQAWPSLGAEVGPDGRARCDVSRLWKTMVGEYLPKRIFDDRISARKEGGSRRDRELALAGLEAMNMRASKKYDLLESLCDIHESHSSGAPLVVAAENAEFIEEPTAPREGDPGWDFHSATQLEASGDAPLAPLDTWITGAGLTFVR